MTDADDIDDLAAGYVLGTLDAAERASVAARRQREPQLNADIMAWERRLSPLNDLVRPVAPPPGVFEKITARVNGARPANFKAAPAADVIGITRRMKRWRTSAIAASALAASLAAVIGFDKFSPKPPSRNLVAVLQKDASSPAFLVSVDVDNRMMTVRPVAAKHETGKSYELWIIHDSLGKPKSLGTVDNPAPVTKPVLADYQPGVIEGSTYAITLEPEGGSPSGAPTGPIVFSGKMLPSGTF